MFWADFHCQTRVYERAENTKKRKMNKIEGFVFKRHFKNYMIRVLIEQTMPKHEGTTNIRGTDYCENQLGQTYKAKRSTHFPCT